MTGRTRSAHDRAVERIRDRVWHECDPAAVLAAGPAAAPRIVAALAESFLSDEPQSPDLNTGRVVEGVVAATLGLGPLSPLLTDPRVSEVMVNGSGQVYVERAGALELQPVAFDDDAHVLRVVDRILAPIGRRVDAMSPIVDARLADGSRVNVVIPPVAVDGPLVTIRRFVRAASTLDDLTRIGSLDPVTALELECLVSTHANVLVSGGTSSGKTTLLAACLHTCTPTQRMVIIEDSAELPLDHEHRVRLETRPAAHEGAEEISMRDLVRTALRMRPDRIIVGEVRGPEAYDLLQALNTGHRGSWSTIHANGVTEALLRLESMVLTAGTGMPQAVVRDHIARAVDAVVQLERDSSGVRRVTHIARVKHVGGDEGWAISDVCACT